MSETPDIVERLRAAAKWAARDQTTMYTCNEAAAEIERLRAVLDQIATLAGRLTEKGPIP